MLFEDVEVNRSRFGDPIVHSNSVPPVVRKQKNNICTDHDQIGSFEKVV